VLAYLKNLPPAAAVFQPADMVAASGGRRLASPKARRLAVEMGVELASLSGSGPQGAILTADVLSQAKDKNHASVQTAVDIPERQAAQDTRTPLPTAGSSPNLATGQELPVSNTWRIMAEHLTRTWTTTPQFNLLRDVNVSRLPAWHAQIEQRSIDKITLSDLFIKFVATALKKHPHVNAAWNSGRILQMVDVNIGLAVAFDGGLVVPVIHQADRLSLSEIASARKELVERARLGKLRLDDIQGGTFTISNLGMYGIDAFTAIVNSPQAAILALGRIAERVVHVAGQAVIQPMVSLSVSFDHRVVDGARGAQFLQTLAEFIEEPLRMFE
jgi:pyruvate dehydrogenase E2 component (dihydrolipoamide acetyltransferase)